MKTRIRRTIVSGPEVFRPFVDRARDSTTEDVAHGPQRCDCRNSHWKALTHHSRIDRCATPSGRNSLVPGVGSGRVWLAGTCGTRSSSRSSPARSPPSDQSGAGANTSSRATTLTNLRVCGSIGRVRAGLRAWKAQLRESDDRRRADSVARSLAVPASSVSAGTTPAPQRRRAPASALPLAHDLVE